MTDYLALVAARQLEEIESFKAAVVAGRVARIPGSPYCFLSNPAATYHEIDSLISRLS